MPKAVLEFSLPEEQNEFETASHAQDWKNVSTKLAESLRSWLKYGHNFTTPEQALTTVRSMLFESMENYRIDID